MKRKYRLPLDPANPTDPRHGTLNGYSNHHCPCQPCRDYGRKYHRDASRVRRGLGLPPDSHLHGTDGGYTNHGCRCTGCKAAHSVAKVEYRTRKHREELVTPAPYGNEIEEVAA